MTVTISGNGTFTGTSLTANNIAANTITSNNILSTSRLVTGNMPAGAVLQVVTATTQTTVSTTSGSQVDTGLTATITPTSTTSKILVLTSCRIFSQPGTPSSVILVRNSTNLQQRYRYGLTDQGNAGSGDQFSTTYLDSPATTSPTTYKVTFARQSGTGTIYAHLDSDMSVMTLMEIAA